MTDGILLWAPLRGRPEAIANADDNISLEALVQGRVP